MPQLHPPRIAFQPKEFPLIMSQPWTQCLHIVNTAALQNTRCTTTQIRTENIFRFFVLVSVTVWTGEQSNRSQTATFFSHIIHFGNLFYSRAPPDKNIEKVEPRPWQCSCNHVHARRESTREYLRRQKHNSERGKKTWCNLNNTAPDGKHHLPDRKRSVKETQKNKYNNKHTISLLSVAAFFNVWC